jgi:hypothetical protein
VEELLEHRGRLGEVALDVEGALAAEAVLPADDVMHEVAELVQEHHHVAVLHEARVPGRAAGEVAYQGAVGELPPVHAEVQGRGGEPLVLALARVHVEVDGAELGGAVDDHVGGDGGCGS